MLFAKKDALRRLFLCLCCFTGLPAVSAPACPTTDYDETTEIKYIVDGDTLHIKNGRKVRLIGINTPEAARDNHAAEPFSAEATNALKTLFTNNKSISLVYGKEKFDRYKRLLAHGFTANGENIQAILLAQGYARAITFPPNAQFSACYLQQERKARCNKTGLWKKIKPLAAKKLNDTHIGFQLVTGKLKNININRKGIWLNLDDKLTIGIRPGNQPLFDIDTIYRMLNKKIVVRGWLNKSKKTSAAISPYYIRVRHPSSIQLASTFACD
jgi:endonuclease YncB( thermonuclease family)